MKIASNIPNDQFGSERKQGISGSLPSFLKREEQHYVSLAQGRVGTTGALE
jgi:hypothetical protein